MTPLSSDPYTNTTSQHKTEVEPDTFSNGSTIVSAFQVGRFSNGGSSNIGWATSTDSGATWTNGFLPGITKILNSSHPYDRVSDPSVAYDTKHGVWLIASLALHQNSNGSVTGVAALISRSTDGGLTWDNPVTVASFGDLDKDWIVCDNTGGSPHYGNCYVQFDDFSAGDKIYMSTSDDGGLTWGSALPTANNATGLGGQPVVQPNGNVIVPAANASESAILAFRSTDGGTSWSSTVTVSAVTDHGVAGGLRSGPLPSAEIDGAGKVYVVWQDCRFETRCKANDIVMSTSTDGITWSSVVRIPIDPANGGIDHFIPGLAVDKATSGNTAHIGLTYYYYPQANCSARTNPRNHACQLDVGFVSSTDGGATWSAKTQLAGPMTLSWLSSTTQGRMVGDYISASFAGGTAHPVFAAANDPSGGPFDEAMYTPAIGLASTAASAVTSSERALPDAASDHAPLLVPATHR